MRKYLANACLSIGLAGIVLAAGVFWLEHSATGLSFTVREQTRNSTPASVLPSHLTIPSIQVDVPIIPAVIQGKTWETSMQGASYLLSSATPGERGNSVIYGHNWSSILGRLPNIKRGDTIRVRLTNGASKTFVVQYTTIVTPDQTHIIEPTAGIRLTLYTCTGFFDTKRFVAVATPI